MRRPIILDTNVPMVANGRHHGVGPDCVTRCIDELQAAIRGRTILLDSLWLIVEEYRRHLSPSGQPGPGDAFFKWLWSNQGNESLCRFVTIRRDETGSKRFEEFPDDPALQGFDPNDHKFVAVACADGSGSPIANASDTDWWDHRDALRRCGVRVRFVCPELMPGPVGEDV